MEVENPKFKRKLFHLDVLLEKQTDCYTAHCLQLDLVTDGDTKADAEAMIVDAISEQITFAIENNLMDHLFQPAPPAEWRKLLYSNHTKTVTLDSEVRPLPITKDEFYQT